MYCHHRHRHQHHRTWNRTFFFLVHNFIKRSSIEMKTHSWDIFIALKKWDGSKKERRKIVKICEIMLHLIIETDHIIAALEHFCCCFFSGPFLSRLKRKENFFLLLVPAAYETLMKVFLIKFSERKLRKIEKLLYIFDYHVQKIY